MRKAVIITSMILLFTYLPLAEADSNGEAQPVNLYFYENGSKEYFLDTDKPLGNTDSDVAIPFGTTYIEIDFRTDTLTTLFINGNFSYTAWISSEMPCMVEFNINLQVYHNDSKDWENIAGFYRRININGEEKLTGSKMLGQNVSLKHGDKLGVNIILSAEGGNNVKLIFESKTHPSHITLDCNPFDIETESIINNESKLVNFNAVTGLLQFLTRSPYISFFIGS